MASSKKLPPGELPRHVENKLRQWQVSGRHLTLALSGGADSVALLDILAQLSATLNFRLSALHIDHRISPNSALWAEFCTGLCAARGVPFQAVEVDIARRRGESLEALARAARHEVFSRQPADFVVLAQHLDDQAETLLLQLLRGAGPKGLSAMGMVKTQTNAPHASPLTPHYLRPLLDVPRRIILDYAAARGLNWVEDESNVDLAFDRNYLRHQVLPLLERRFPGYRETFARASRNLAESAGLLDELARLDCAAAVVDGRLKVDVLRGLSEPRAKNLLRHWLSGLGLPAPSAGRLESLLQQLCGSRDDAQVRVGVGDAVVRRFRGEVYVEKGPLAPQPELALTWTLEDTLELPECGGRLLFERVVGEGLSLARLAAAPVTVRLRRGGERLRPDCRRPHRTLKNLFQEAGVPPWQRQRLPLLFCGERLVFVPGLGVDCEYRAAENEPGVVVKFEGLR